MSDIESETLAALLAVKKVRDLEIEAEKERSLSVTYLRKLRDLEADVQNLTLSSDSLADALGKAEADRDSAHREIANRKIEQLALEAAMMGRLAGADIKINHYATMSDELKTERDALVAIVLDIQIPTEEAEERYLELATEIDSYLTHPRDEREWIHRVRASQQEARARESGREGPIPGLPGVVRKMWKGQMIQVCRECGRGNHSAKPHINCHCPCVPSPSGGS